MPAFFFDLDGTLVDTRADLAATVNHTRRELDLAELPQEQVLAHVGQGAKYLLAHAIPERADDVELLWQVFRSHYLEHALDQCALYPGVAETLEELRRRGCPLGVNTSKPNFATRPILGHLGILGYFGDAIIAGGDLAELKPSPLPLRECAARLGRGLEPTDWMVGDNWTDVRCAANAGIRSAFCRFGFGVPDSVPATVGIDSFTELLEL